MGSKLVLENRNSALCYVPFVGWMPAVMFLVVEKDSEVRRSALQSLLAHTFIVGFYWVVLPLLSATIVLRPFTSLVSGFVGVVFFVMCLVAVTGASEGKKIVWPLVSEWTDKILKIK